MSFWRFLVVITLVGSAFAAYFYHKQLERSRKAIESFTVTLPQMKEYLAGRKAQLQALVALKASAAKVEGQTSLLKSKLDAIKTATAPIKAEFDALVASAKELAQSAQSDPEAGSVSAPELKLANGRVLKDARLRKLEADRASFYHADGISSVALDELPADFRAKLEIKTSTVFSEVEALLKQLSVSPGGQQTFDGLMITCPFSLVEAADKIAISPPLLSIKRYGAKLPEFEINVASAKYADGTAIDLATAANGALQAISRLEGVSNPVVAVKDATMAGAAAKRASLKADRYGKKLLVESLYVGRGSQMWFIQVVLGGDDTSNSFVAERILATAKLQGSK